MLLNVFAFNEYEMLPVRLQAIKMHEPGLSLSSMDPHEHIAMDITVTS